MWLDNNCIKLIEGLGSLQRTLAASVNSPLISGCFHFLAENLVELRCLFLQSNAISEIQNLETLINLRTLNLSSNLISTVPYVGYLKNLSTLDLSRNMLCTATDLEALVDCPNLR